MTKKTPLHICVPEPECRRHDPHRQTRRSYGFLSPSGPLLLTTSVRWSDGGPLVDQRLSEAPKLLAACASLGLADGTDIPTYHLESPAWEGCNFGLVRHEISGLLFPPLPPHLLSQHSYFYRHVEL